MSIQFLTLLIFISLHSWQSSFATTTVFQHSCRSHFAQNDILNKFSSEEKNNLETGARSLANLLGKPDSQHLQAKADVDITLQKFISDKNLNAQEILEFKLWFKGRIQFYQNLKKEHTNGILSEQQRRLQNLERQKIEFEKLRPMIQKYKAQNWSEALISAHNTLASANPEQLQDILFILDRYEQLELTGEIFQILVQYDHLPAVQYFIHNKIKLDYQDSKDPTPLYIAAERNPNPAVITLLIEADNGAQLNTQDKTNGETPLHAAIRFNPNTEIFKTLLAAGADATLKNLNNQLALHHAIPNRGIDINMFLALIRATGPKYIDTVNKFGDTPLHRAVLVNRDKDFVKALLQAGADPSIKDKKGLTALDIALKREKTSLDTLKILIAVDQGTPVHEL